MKATTVVLIRAVKREAAAKPLLAYARLLGVSIDGLIDDKLGLTEGNERMPEKLEQKRSPLFLINIESSCTQDLVSRTKNLPRALFRNRVRVNADALIEPVLQIPATVIGTLKAQCFAA